MPQTLLSLVSLIVMVAVCGGAALVGGRRVRIDALALLVSIFASIAVQRASRVWDPVLPLTAIDLALLIVFIVVAWRPRRGWPLWAVALQGLTVAIDGLRAAEIGMAPYTYLVAVNLSTYGLTVVIAYAGWQGWRDRRRARLYS